MLTAMVWIGAMALYSAVVLVAPVIEPHQSSVDGIVIAYDLVLIGCLFALAVLATLRLNGVA